MLYCNICALVNMMIDSLQWVLASPWTSLVIKPSILSLDRWSCVHSVVSQVVGVTGGKFNQPWDLGVNGKSITLGVLAIGGLPRIPWCTEWGLRAYLLLLSHCDWHQWSWYCSADNTIWISDITQYKLTPHAILGMIWSLPQLSLLFECLAYSSTFSVF